MGWASESFAGAGQHRLAFVEAGPKSNRPSIVFVHGAGGDRKGWLPLLREISNRGLHGIALDLPGHGQSPGPGCRSISDYARIAGAFIQETGLISPVLAGHSMGGAVALTCGLEFPEKLGGLILVATGSRLRVKESILAGVRLDFESTAADIVRIAYSPKASPGLAEEGRRQLLECGPEVLHGDLSACDAFSEMERIEGISLPSLIVCGEEDLMTPPKYSRYLAEKIPTADLRLIPEAGHMVMAEKPRQVGETIHGFIQAP
ncbi:MAG: alpha/beta hydrolase [Nitrospinota bacterium]